MSATDLTSVEPYLGLTDADPEAVKTFTGIVNRFGDECGLDSEEKVKHFLAQVAHENANRVLGAEMDVPLSDKGFLGLGSVRRTETKKDGDSIFNYERVIKKQETSVLYFLR